MRWSCARRALVSGSGRWLTSRRRRVSWRLSRAAAVGSRCENEVCAPLCSSRMIALPSRLGITIGRENTSKEHYCETVYAAGGGGGDRVLRLQRLQSCWRYVLYCTRPTSSLLSPCLLPSDLPLLLPPPRDVTCRVRFSTSFSLHVSLSN